MIPLQFALRRRMMGTGQMLWLYDRGDERAGTGGLWTQSGYTGAPNATQYPNSGTVTKYAEYMTIDSPLASTATPLTIAGKTNAVDVSRFSRLSMLYDAAHAYMGLNQTYTMLGISAQKSNCSNGGVARVHDQTRAELTGTGRLLTLDVSAVNAPVYIFVNVCRVTCNVRKIWLEA